MSVKCIVNGCLNHINEGQFIGDICIPCREMIVTGKISSGHTFIHQIRDEWSKQSQHERTLHDALATSHNDLRDSVLTLIHAKGRHNTAIAYTRLVDFYNKS